MDTQSEAELKPSEPTLANGDAQSPEQKRRQKAALLKVLPSDRLSFPKQIDALRAYAIAYDHSGKPVSNVEAGKIVDMSENTLVVTNAFFTDAGFLTRVEGGFVPAEETKQFAKTEAWNKEVAPEKLRPLIERQWFAQLIVPRLRMRPLSKDEVLHVLAEAAGASAKERERVECLVEYLCFVRVIKQEGDGYRLNQVVDSSSERTPQPPAPQPPTPEIIKDKDDDLEEHTITLNPVTKTKMIIKCPATMTEAELTRVKNWLSYQIMVTPTEKPQNQL
jgi:hypothetical protein